MLSAGFEPTIPASERPQNHARPLGLAGIMVSFHFYLQQDLFCMHKPKMYIQNFDSKIMK